MPPTYWGPGGIDVAGIPAASTPRDGIRLLAAQPGHPYAILGEDVAEALEWLRPLLAAGGAEYLGDLETPLQLVPTSIGGTRRAAILPAGQAAARSPVGAGRTPDHLRRSGLQGLLARGHCRQPLPRALWDGGSRPAAVTPISVALPGLGTRHNLNGLVIARRFDDPAWRAKAIDALARAIEAVPGSGGRVGLPAVLGFDSTSTFSRRCRSASPRHCSRCPSSRRACRERASSRRFVPRSSGPVGASRSERWSSGWSTTGAV